ncbi:hypothetical protein [Nostoc punctiforme]
MPRNAIALLQLTVLEKNFVFWSLMCKTEPRYDANQPDFRNGFN